MEKAKQINSDDKLDVTSDDKSEKTWKRIKIFKTIMLVFPFAAMGMTHSIQYTTIPDMRNRLGVGVQELSFAMSLGSAGGLFGGPMGSIVDRFSKQADLIISLTLFTVGVSYTLFPWSPNVWSLGILDFVFSLGWGLYQAAAHSVITHIWGTEGGPARYAIHFGYPVGSMLGPLVAIPFIYGVEDTGNATTEAPPDGAQQWYHSRYAAVVYSDDDGAIVESRHFDDGSSIEYAYLLIGLFIAVNATVFMILQLLQKQLHVTANQTTNSGEKASFKQVLTPSEWADGDGKFGAVFLILMCIYFVIQTATHKGTQEYLVTYAVDSGMFEATEAATLNSVVYAAGACARALAIVVARYVPAPYILFGVAHGQLLCGLLCLLFGTRSRVNLWIFAPCLGFFRELMWPTGFAYTDYYIILLGVIVGITDMVAMLFNIGLISLQGYLYENTVIESIFYTTVLFGALLCLHIYVTTFYASRKGGRKARATEEEKHDLTLHFESTKL